MDKMYIYIVVIKDRHIDIDITPFRKKQDAIEYAKKTAKEYCRHPEDFEEILIDDFIYYAEYSCESDCVWVEERKLI